MRKGHGCGHINVAGEFVVPPIYAGAANFSEGRAAVTGDAGSGYVSRDGREVTPCEFGWTYPFSEGLAVVMGDATLAATAPHAARAMGEREKPFGYIDPTGSYAIEPAYISAGSFSQGLAWVEYDVEKSGAIDPSGHIQPVDMRHFSPFEEGYARFQGMDWRKGFMDTELRVVIPPIYEDVGDFSEGLAYVTEDLVANRSYFVNPGGDRVLSFDVPCEHWFTSGRLAVRIGRQWGFVDKTGEMVIPPLFEATGYGFYDGLAAVRLDGEWGFVDLEGNLVIEPRFDEVMCFGDGLAPVRVGASWGYVNTAGDVVIEPRFDALFGFTRGLAPAQFDGLWGFVNRAGELAIEPRFREVGSFHEGLARVELPPDAASR